MNVQILYPGVHTPIRRDLEHELLKAQKCDIAVAFMTRRGIEFLRCNLHNRLDWRLVVSVRYPTDLKVLNELVKHAPNRVWIHLAGYTPEEKRGHKYQLHTKLVRIESGQNKIKTIVGSHNWTGMALEGINIENSVLIECASTDQAAVDSLNHFEGCLKESVPFDPADLDYYLFIQKKLDGKGLSEEVPEFIEDQKVVMLCFRRKWSFQKFE